MTIKKTSGGRVSRSRRCLTVIFRIILVLIGIEIGIRIAEFGYYFYFERIAVRRSLKDQDGYRIVCIGESTVQGGSATNDRGDFPSQLEKLLNERFPDKTITVYNLGIDAIFSHRIYNNLDYNLNYCDPHLVVLLAGHNIHTLPLIFRNTKNKYIARGVVFINNLKVIRLLGFLTVYTRQCFEGYTTPLFYLYLSRFPEAPIGRPMNVIAIYHNKDIKKQNQMYYEILQLRSRIWLEAIAQRLMQKKVKVILCSYFDSWVNKYIRDMAGKYDLLLCDTEKTAQEYIAAGKRHEIMSGDDWHPNDKGYYLMAQDIYNTILENKLISDE